jgi:hypothetical protein
MVSRKMRPRGAFVRMLCDTNVGMSHKVGHPGRSTGIFRDTLEEVSRNVPRRDAARDAGGRDVGASAVLDDTPAPALRYRRCGTDGVGAAG